jgi:hypothetical protein
LKILTTALDEHCISNSIDPSGPEREELSRLVMAHFSRGAHSAEALKAVLENASARDERDAR